jgi:hypothetical protein
MRYASIIVIMFMALPGCGRMVKVPDQERLIRQVYTVEMSRNEIYDRALEWCAKKLAGTSDDIVVRDREKGKIIGKGTGKYSEYFDFLVDREFSYNLTIEIKDGRYRVTYDNFTVYYDERQVKSSKAEFKFELNKIGKQVGKLMEDLHNYVAGGASGKEKDVNKKEEEW